MPWRDDPAALAAWQPGRTGYALVDAGMRQLWETGWMHNRVRMVAASFLTKHLLIDWREGARWFWDTLVDADLANNTLGWQWVAGSGADAAPYHRIFSPSGRRSGTTPMAATAIAGSTAASRRRRSSITRWPVSEPSPPTTRCGRLNPASLRP
jgi:deoxyribodipyrimidine photolyase